MIEAHGVIYLSRVIMRVNIYDSLHGIRLWAFIAYTGCVLCEVGIRASM